MITLRFVGGRAVAIDSPGHLLTGYEAFKEGLFFFGLGVLLIGAAIWLEWWISQDA